MSNHIPEGNFVEDHLVWQLSGKSWIISRGFDVQVPELSTSDDEQWLRLQDCLRRILCSLPEDERLQVLFYTGSDFEAEMDRFDGQTRETPSICKEVRNELLTYFRERMTNQTLIRSTIRLYLSKKIKRARASAFDEILANERRTFELRRSYFDVTLKELGGSCTALDNWGHYQEMLKFWSPGQEPSENPDYDRSVEELCRYSDIAPRVKTEKGFYLNGHYVGLYMVKLMPSRTWPRSIEPIFNLSSSGVRVAINLFGLSVAKEIAHEDDRFRKLAKNMDKASVIAGRNQHVDRITELQSNLFVPFRAQMVVMVYERSKEGLDDKMEAVKGALDKVGFQSLRVSLPVSAVSFFNCATPGYGSFLREDFSHKIGDEHLANLVPAASTDTAELAQADWMACGNRDHPIGGRLFFGAQPSDALVIGTKGSGKSALVQTILLQAAQQLNFLGVIDNGASYIETCRLLDPTCKPIIVRSRSGHTFNLFDTRGLALSAEHLRSAVALAELLVGKSSDEDRQADRSDLLSKTIRTIYHRCYDRWRNKFPEAHYRACRRTVLALQHGEDFIDSVQALNQTAKSHPDQLLAMEAGVSEEEAMRIADDKLQGHYVEEYAFSTWTPSMFPRLYDLWEDLNTQRYDRNPSPHCGGLADRLARWLHNGEYGPLVDGVTNIDLGTSYVTKDSPLKVVYFELGAMKDSEEELRSIISFLITTELRHVIQSMPRGVRKALVVEELTAFLRMQNAAKIIQDFSERMRKYQCWLACVFQQYLSLLKADPGVAEALLGNAQSLFLLRNVNRTELTELDKHIRIPEPVKNAIQEFPMPEHMAGRPDQYAGFVYVTRSEGQPKFTIGRNVISAKVGEITSSSGDVFEEKMKRVA